MERSKCPECRHLPHDPKIEKASRWASCNLPGNLAPIRPPNRMILNTAATGATTAMIENEKLQRRDVSKKIRNSFKYSATQHTNAVHALRSFRPKRRRGKREKITYLDLFNWGEYPFPNLNLDEQLSLIPDAVDFILNDKVSCEAEWSALIFCESVIRSDKLRAACSVDQKRAICEFISYLIDWRLRSHGCEIFKDKLEVILAEWSLNIFN